MRRSSREAHLARAVGPFPASAMCSRSNRDGAVVAYAAATASAVPSRCPIFITRLTQSHVRASGGEDDDTRQCIDQCQRHDSVGHRGTRHHERQAPDEAGPERRFGRESTLWRPRSCSGRPAVIRERREMKSPNDSSVPASARPPTSRPPLDWKRVFERPSAHGRTQRAVGVTQSRQCRMFFERDASPPVSLVWRQGIVQKQLAQRLTKTAVIGLAPRMTIRLAPALVLVTFQ